MALGATLSATLDVSTTLGFQTLTFTSDGRTVVQSLIDSGGSLTVCVMSYHFDYSNNAPVQDGDFNRIKSYYGEGSGAQRPVLLVGSSPISSVYAESTGDDDDALLSYVTYDGSVSWDTVRGDSTTTGTHRRDSDIYLNDAVSTWKLTGKGADVITQNRRTYLVFDLSGISGATADVVNLGLRCDNLGTYTGDFGKIIAVQATALAGTTADYGNCFVADAVTVTDNATFFGANF